MPRRLLSTSTLHHQRLNAVVSTLPAHSGLVADELDGRKI